MTTKLLTDSELERSAIVANCCMNRERGLRGSNGYDQELRIDPLQALRRIVQLHGCASWLDLCCGAGRALIEASNILEAENTAVQIIGVDLVGQFDSFQSAEPTLEQASLNSWQPARTFDLVTCVHGLHYIGDKLRLILRARSWLTPSGIFVANLDANNLKLHGRPDSRPIVAWLRRNGFRYSRRIHLLEAEGPREPKNPFEYLGADDAAGPNYTGQEAIDSYYQKPN